MAQITSLTKTSLNESDIDMDDSDIDMGGSGGSYADLSSDVEDNSQNDLTTTKSVAWAKAMSNVLRSKSKTTSFILSKANKDSDILAKRAVKEKEIEFVDSTGGIIETAKKTNKKQITTYSQKRKEMMEKMKQKKEWEAMGRVKPNIINKEKERELVRIATKGIVHLFNTVEKHQKDSMSNSKEKKKQSNAKGAFMDVLKQFSKAKSVQEDPEVKKAKHAETWSILKDDFMMGAEMKDWDKSDNET